MKDNEKLLTPGEVMVLLNISYATLLRMARRQEIPCVRLSKSMRFPRSFFENLVDKAIARVEAVAIIESL